MFKLSKDLFLNILYIIFPLYCAGCGQENRDICENCKRQKPNLINIENILRIDKTKQFKRKVNAYSLFWYKGKIRNIILSFKNQNRQNLLYYLGSILAETIYKFLKSKTIENNPCSCIVYPPSTKKTIRKRGYYPMELLAKYIQKYLLEIYNFEVKISKNLKLVKNIDAQKGKNAKDRLSNKIYAYEFLAEKMNSEYILIDDVISSGSTIKEALRAMEEKRVEPFLILSLAKT